MIKSSACTHFSCELDVYRVRENPLLKCQLLHDLFHFFRSFLAFFSLWSCNHAWKLSKTFVTIWEKFAFRRWKWILINFFRKFFWDDGSDFFDTKVDFKHLMFKVEFCRKILETSQLRVFTSLIEKCFVEIFNLG